MRGDLDPRDAGCAAAVAECVNFLRVLLERLGDEFGDHLRVNLLGGRGGWTRSRTAGSTCGG